MKVAGFQKNSFVDYPGKIATVVFTPGCNLNCHYCHNRKLLSEEAMKNIIPEVEIFNFLKERQAFLDAVVVSGGEPTLQPGLKEFMRHIKRLGFKTKLDTNGTNPEVINSLIDKKLIDYVAMDIKAPFDRYKEITESNEYVDKINQSIDLLMDEDIDYEFRTTFTPRLKKEDIIIIAQRIKGARVYVLQQFRSIDENGNLYGELDKEKPHSTEHIKKVTDEIKGLFKLCYTRGL